MKTVMIHPATHDSLRPAIDRAFEIFPMDFAGKTVLIKPNALRTSAADEAIVTHPSVVRAVVEKVETLNPAAIIVGDNPGVVSYGANEECFEKTGLMAAAKGHYRNIGNDPVKVDFNPAFIPSVSVSRIVMEADIIISLPRFKTHGLTVISGALKNSYGILPGAQKSILHKIAGSPERFHEVVVEVFKLRVPDLFILDAVVGMEGNGPASPDLREIGLILAADNGVAMDAVIAAMMGCDPACLRFLQKAKEDGLGDYDLKTVNIIGKLDVIPDFKLPPVSGEAITGNIAIQEMLASKNQFRPRVDQNLCTACGTCVAQCPVSALTMAGEFPEVDHDTCIICFCCQELCPEKAIRLS
ncbi:MAG: DUF362 domain-containing protein [Desulfobacteraceae bacterium]|nr:MAG: DUF362 domain-containing protein [Desulfobacteraceae bacterium]